MRKRVAYNPVQISESLSFLSLSNFCLIFNCQQASGNAVNMQGAHAVAGRSVPRPMIGVGMPRMPPQGMGPYNLASQAGMGMNPGGIPMQRGVSAQAHQQQQVGYLCQFY